MLLMRGPQPEDQPTETKEEKPGQLRILAALPPPIDDFGGVHSNSIEKDDAINQSMYFYYITFLCHFFFFQPK